MDDIAYGNTEADIAFGNPDVDVAFGQPGTSTPVTIVCEPSDLLAAAKCFMCMDRQTAAAVAVLSLVAYANEDIASANVILGEGGEDLLGEGGENIVEQ